MSSDSDDNWDEMELGTNGLNHISLGQKDVPVAGVMATIRPQIVSNAASSSASPLEPLLADYRGLCSSLDASSLVLSSLKHQMADCYMDTLMKSTLLQQQLIQLDYIELQDKVERLKMAGDRSRALLGQLRKDYDEVLQEVSRRRKPSSPLSIEPASSPSVNTWFTILLFVLPLIVIFMVSRMILAPSML